MFISPKNYFQIFVLVRFFCSRICIKGNFLGVNSFFSSAWSCANSSPLSPFSVSKDQQCLQLVVVVLQAQLQPNPRSRRAQSKAAARSLVESCCPKGFFLLLTLSYFYFYLELVQRSKWSHRAARRLLESRRRSRSPNSFRSRRQLERNRLLCLLRALQGCFSLLKIV